MTLANQVLQLEFQAAYQTRKAYQRKVRENKWSQPATSDFLTKAYKLAYATWSDSEPDARTLAGLLKLYEGEADTHFAEVSSLPKQRRPSDVQPVRWTAARGGQIGTLAQQSDVFTRYWLNSFANRGILAAGLESSKYTRKVWVAQLDVYTSDICSHLNGEIRYLDENYSWANFTGLIPPGHFRCRSLIRLLP